MSIMKINEKRGGKLMRVTAAAVVMIMTLLGSFAGMQTEAHAVSGIYWGRAVNITGYGQVVDSITVNGKTVQSIYKPKTDAYSYDRDATFCCAAFVKRFYKTVFGVDVWNLYPGNVPSVSSGSFVKTNSPRTGDIAANPGHWAIVKSVSADGVCVIEQNCWSTGYKSALVGRVLGPQSGYWYFRWSGSNVQSQSAPAPQVNFTFDFENNQVYDTNAVIRAKVNNPARVRVTQIGCKIYNAAGQLIKSHNESCSRPESRFSVWYDINKELGMTLTRGTTYKYQFFINYGGKTFTSNTGTFKTTGQAPVAAAKAPSIKNNSPTGFSYGVGVNDITSNYAVIKFTINNPYRIRVRNVGYVLYKNGRQVGSKTFRCDCSSKSFYVKYYPANDFGRLSSRTRYSYKTFVYHNGVRYMSTLQNFTTR